MIVTVTANPSLDRTLTIDTLRPGAVHRVTEVRVEPSGKGVNVAIALHRTGHDVTAVLVGGPPLTGMLDDLGVAHVAVPIVGTVRTNTTVLESDGRTTKLNEPGPTLAPAEVTALMDAAQAGAGPAGDWVAWCGSLPAGFGAAALSDAVAAGRAAGRRVALDTSEGALAHVLAGPRAVLPDLVKPNADELAELVGRPLSTLGAAADAAADLVRRGIGTVLVSLGGDGALLVDADGAWHGEAPAARVVNTAGAGDAFLAGYLSAAGLDPPARLAAALRYGAAAVEQAGTLLTGVDPARPVRLGPVDRARRLGP